MIGEKSPPQHIASGTLGHYNVIEKIGAGGMGVVYKGRDTHLGRLVALKVLPPGSVADPESRHRFAQEAKAASALNHPNIITIYDISNTDGVDFIAMELVEGRTLEQLIGHCRLPLKQVLAYAIQIADALGKAHGAGIIHRDLKPSNIMITGEDNVKILDFGLAKLVATSGLGNDEPTASTAEILTKEGKLLGTAAYMAPEQAEGKPVDARCDIFSFGLILYEMITGRRPFHGNTKLALLTAVLHEEPTPPSQLVPSLSGEVERVVMRCLRKDPQRRWQSMPDLKSVLEDLKEESASSKLPLTVARHFPFGWLAARAAIVLIAGLLIGLAVRKTTQSTASFPIVRAVIKLEQGLWLDGMRHSQRPSRTAVTMSKDGRFIVYSASTPARPQAGQLYLRRTDQLEAKPIAGTEGGINPFLSPDDRWVGFWSDDKLMKVSIDGGVPVALCDAKLLFGASWGLDNSIIFANANDSGLFRVSAEGGKTESWTVPERTKEEFSHRLPHYLPDGQGVLFTIMSEPFDLRPRTALLDIKTRKWRVLMEDAADARYVPTGHLVFLRQGTLMTVPFDLGRHEVMSHPVPVIADVMQALNVTFDETNTAAGQFSISDSGWLVYAGGGILPDRQSSLAWVDQQGKGEAIASFKAPFFAPRLSPDGQRIAYTTLGRESQVFVYDLNRGTANQLTGEGKTNFVTWTPDGKGLVFAWWKAGTPSLYWEPADGSAAMERLTTSDHWQVPGSCSPDGATLAFVESRGSDGSGYGIFLLDLRSRRITPFLNSHVSESYAPVFSPDWSWMAYVSHESGRRDVYVRPFPGPGGKWLISREGGSEPLWSRDGKQLFYRHGPQIWAVDVRADHGFFAGKPRLLFEDAGWISGGPVRTWDLSLDGRRFLMVKVEEVKPTPVTELVLVMNWFQDLQRLAPTGKK